MYMYVIVFIEGVYPQLIILATLLFKVDFLGGVNIIVSLESHFAVHVPL